MTLSIGAATDYLVNIAASAVSGMTVNGQPVVVADGEPDELTFGMFVIGLDTPPPDTSGDTAGTRAWMGLGAKRVEDDYLIPCYVDVRVAGNVQKTARDAAVGIFNAFWPLFAADLTLGGALTGGRYAEIVNYIATARSVGTVAEPGRRQFIQFAVHCRSLTT